MKIDPTTLVAVATPLLARIQALREADADYTDLAFQALGMLQTFVEGFEEGSEAETE
jgi:hypothetical protein